MTHLITATIRPHLISFLYEELQGDVNAQYAGKKVKLAKISNASVLGQMITAFKANLPEDKQKCSGFSVFLTLNENETPTGTFHLKRGDQYKVLELLEVDVVIINNYLESIFSISLQQFVRGFIHSYDNGDFVNQAIHHFMIEHNLYDTEIDPESLRRRYYNLIKKEFLLTKIQNQVSVKSKYYAAK